MSDRIDLAIDLSSVISTLIQDVADSLSIPAIPRIRKGHAARNIAIVKKTALNLFNIVKRHKPRVSFKQMRKMAGWDQDFMHLVLSAQF